MVAASFIFFLLIFAAIGWFSMQKSEHSTVDYLVAGRNVPPWLAGLSAVATNNSGYMFIGMIGLTYTTGLSSVWLMIGWILGDIVASFLMMKQVRITTEKQDIHSFGGLMAQWHHTDYNVLRRISGVLTIIFLGSYAAAQFNAGSKALHVLFGWNLSAGAIIGAVLVLLYSYSGGLRASIWTDAAQSFVMIISMLMLMVVAADHIGTAHQIYTTLAAVGPHYMDWMPHTSVIGILLFIAGWVFAGFGVAGQPHIVIRYMTLDKPENINRFRGYYYAWFIAFYSATIVVGLLARVLLPDAGHFDAELALPMLSVQLLPGVLVGLMLAGLFAATMSTADSLILSCSAALTRDLLPEHKGGYAITKMATGGVVLVALAIAISGNKSVFQLVLISWGLLASAFVPLLAVYALGGKPSERLAVAMMAAGIGVFFLWRELGLSHIAYEVMPAMLAGVFVFVVTRKFLKLSG